MTVQEIFAQALAAHQAGRLPEAERGYRQVLAAEPNHAPALQLLGLIAFAAGNPAAAAELIQRAIALQGDVPEFHYNLAHVLTTLGRRSEAIDAFRATLQLDPNHADARHCLGAQLMKLPDLPAAITELRQAAALQPQHAELRANLGLALLNSGQLEAAAAEFRAAIALKPTLAPAHNSLAVALAQLGRAAEATAHFREAVRLDPGNAPARANLSLALQQIGRLDEAAAIGAEAIRLAPNYAEAHAHLGATWQAMGRMADAIAAYETAARLKPTALILTGLAGARLVHGDLDGAVAACEAAIRADPNHAGAYNNLGAAQKDRGELDAAIASFRRAIALEPRDPAAHDNLLVQLHYHPATTVAQLREEHRRWNEQHAAPLRPRRRPHRNERDPERPLRIGYVSADFCSHAAARFLLGLFRQHDRRSFEVHCYSNTPAADDVTRQLQALAPAWHPILGRPDDHVAEQIRTDGIDLLVDLSSHSKGNRLPLFARKPAPVQVTWLAYAGATGLETIDYRLSDPFLDPPAENEPADFERCVRLPETFWCYEPLPIAAEAPGGSAAPAAITFGCLNNFCKVTPLVLEAWAEILQRVPDSHLILHAPEGETRRGLHEFFRTRGVEPARLTLHGRRSLAQYHATYRQIDVALDPHPFGGGTTTCDALWMGVPVVSLAGATPVSRAGLSLLSNAGLPELVAHTRADYVRLACELAADRARRTELRATLRARLERSPLMDASRFARNVEAAYRTMWRRWCESSAR